MSVVKSNWLTPFYSGWDAILHRTNNPTDDIKSAFVDIDYWGLTGSGIGGLQPKVYLLFGLEQNP
jgi:hypothetical protein